jgi:hypothetical protein
LKDVSERSLGWLKENHFLDQKVWEREAKMVVFLFWKWDATLKIEDSHEDHICQEGH